MSNNDFKIILETWQLNTSKQKSFIFLKANWFWADLSWPWEHMQVCLFLCVLCAYLRGEQLNMQIKKEEKTMRKKFLIYIVNFSGTNLF